MRLLHTSALTLKEFFGDGIPPYAVLSHRWEEEEVTLQDLTNGGAKELLGYGKLMGCCERAKHDGLDYVWIDTCCIDKTSSAELSEAINSMFEWYQASYICYVYLSDVLEEAEQISEAQSSFRNSKWFTRGWTLQELIAPTWVQFFNAEWRDLGTKSSLRTLIEHITNIRHLSDFRSATIAQKMSWASNRNTTRVEDQAYCLMGLFQIHMPIIYGEGKNAFLRLQLEIIKSSDDESIFAWSYPSKTPLVDKGIGMLATSPTYFRGSGMVGSLLFDEKDLKHTMTNKGLRLERRSITHEDGRHILPLNCSEKHGFVLAVGLHRSTQGFARTPQSLFSFEQKYMMDNRFGKLRSVFYVAQAVESYISLGLDLSTHYYIDIDTKELVEAGFTLSTDIQPHSWNLEDPKRPILFHTNRHSLSTSLKFSCSSSSSTGQISSRIEFRLILAWKGSLCVGIRDESSWTENSSRKVGPYEIAHLCLTDRTSELLLNGSSVTAIVRKKRIQDSEGYSVILQYHHKGKLPWRQTIGRGESSMIKGLEPELLLDINCKRRERRHIQ